MDDSLKLLEYFEARRDESMKILRRLVDLESNSLDKPGVDALAAYVARMFESMGAAVQVLPHATRGNALEVLWRTGGSKAPVLILGHLDTVWPKDTVRSRPFRIEGGKAYGPGIFDMKSGILLSIMLCQAQAGKLLDPGRDIRFFFSADEEIGTQAGLPHLKRIAQGCRAVLCLEPPLPGGKAKTFRKGVGSLRLRVHGIPAHAGVDPEKGANALFELSKLVTEIHKMTDYSRGLTASVCTFRAGTAVNVIPAEAEAEVDLRCSSVTDGLWLEERIRSLQPSDPRCTLSIEGELNRPPLERTAAVVELYQRARAVAANLGMDLGEGPTGGGSDGSFTAAMGIPTLDGLGVAGDGAHAIHEHIEIDDIPRRGALLCGLVASLED